MFEAAGCRDLRTYIQSGNVVFRASRARASRVPDVVARTVLDRIGFRAPVVTRSAAELAAVARDNPFLAAGAPPEALHVAFLADRPDHPRIAALDSDRSPPDAFRVVGREIFLYLPNGVARSKLTNAYFDTKLQTTCTIRNWRTVRKLVEMTTEG
jgi:uncharacterized protein (DUF1697 family)